MNRYEIYYYEYCQFWPSGVSINAHGMEFAEKLLSSKIKFFKKPCIICISDIDKDGTEKENSVCEGE